MIIVDKLSEKAIEFATSVILKTVKDKNKSDLWKCSIKKACKVTEGIDEYISDYIFNSSSVRRHFMWLISNKPLVDVYRSFILTIAVELCEFNVEKTYAVSLGMAILDNWFELNEIECCELRNSIAGDEIVEIVNNRERLFKEYFMMYNDPLAKDIIRVYYPMNGENWIRWDKTYSLDIKVNLSKGTEYGFCRTGFSYTRIKSDESEKILQVAYIDEDREIFRFEQVDMCSIDKKKILWVY